MNRKLMAGGIAAAGLTTVLIAGGVAFAATGTTTRTSLAQAIATKFSLNKDDVQKVIDSTHEADHAARLDEQVTAGKITADQKTKILAEEAVIKPKLDAARDLTDPVARKTAMDAIRTEVQAWEKANNIPARAMGPGGHGGMGMGMGRGHMGAPDND
jgi:hypothetical protein